MKKLVCESGGSLNRWGYLLRHDVVYGWCHQGGRYLCCARPDLSWEECEARALAFVRGEIAEKIKEPSKLADVINEPRYDDVFFQGVAWLDSLASESTPAKQLKMFE